MILRRNLVSGKALVSGIGLFCVFAFAQSLSGLLLGIFIKCWGYIAIIIDSTTPVSTILDCMSPTATSIHKRPSIYQVWHPRKTMKLRASIYTGPRIIRYLSSALSVFFPAFEHVVEVIFFSMYNSLAR